MRQIMLTPTRKSQHEASIAQTQQKQSVSRDLASGGPSTLQSPGKGLPPKGFELKRITADILARLDEEFFEVPYEADYMRELNMPELEWDIMKLRSHIKDMDSVEFWQ